MPRALADQKDVELQVIVVDDGSTDNKARSAAARRNRIRHEVNRGLAAARNTGVGAATAPLVAFLDDDCEPEPAWARELLAGRGGRQSGLAAASCRARRTASCSATCSAQPAVPLELDLAVSAKLPYRLYRYVLRQWQPEERDDKRAVYSLVGANMSFLRSALLETPFDERFRFGAEDLDLCLRMPRDHPGSRLVTLDAVVKHHFVPSLRDTLRRSRGYGRGCARLYRKWPSMRPDHLPRSCAGAGRAHRGPVLPAGAGRRGRVPQLMYPKGLMLAVTTRRAACVLDAYVQLAEEAFGNVGYIKGMWTYRHLVPEPATPVATAAEPACETSVGSSAWQ